jgi:hypothetical protein
MTAISTFRTLRLCLSKPYLKTSQLNHQKQTLILLNEAQTCMRNSLKGLHYKIKVFNGDDPLHALDDNVDVEVIFDNGLRFSATFFTLKNIHSLFEKNRRTGECKKGLYFWCVDMIIVEKLSRHIIAKTVAALISS